MFQSREASPTLIEWLVNLLPRIVAKSDLQHFQSLFLIGLALHCLLSRKIPAAFLLLCLLFVSTCLVSRPDLIRSFDDVSVGIAVPLSSRFSHPRSLSRSSSLVRLVRHHIPSALVCPVYPSLIHPVERVPKRRIRLLSRLPVLSSIPSTASVLM